MGNRYGPRDAASVLMGRGHKLTAQPDHMGEYVMIWAYTLDGQPATWRQLEDKAEEYEPLRYRLTDRLTGPPGPLVQGPAGRLRRVSVVTDLHRLVVPVRVGNQGVSIRRGLAKPGPYGAGVRGGPPA